MATKIITVSQLNRYVKSLLDGASPLSNVSVKGEISNLSAYKSGHLYFTIKDELSSIKAVMFCSNATRMRFKPENGMEIIAIGDVSLYERDGNYQINVVEIIPNGAGNLALAYEQLKQLLTKEGLFEESHKKSIPAFPKRIGVITSLTGAVIHDILTTLNRKCPLVTAICVHSKVQGQGASQQLVKAIELLNKDNVCDVIIIGRGGGSIEELWAFNEEPLIRAIYNSNIPIISAIGHETDFTLCDFASDVRAPTPTAAAEMAVLDISIIKETLVRYNDKLKDSYMTMLSVKGQKLEYAQRCLNSKSPVFLLDINRQQLNSMIKLFDKVIKSYLLSKHNELASKSGMLNLLSPLKVLSRGYSIVLKQDGSIVSSSEDVSVGEHVSVMLNKGKIKAEILQRE